jgi:fructokinase
MLCVGTGFIALDVIRSIVDGNTILERRYAGGSCGNVLAVLSYLGLNTAAVGRIGDDEAGSELLADLRHCRVQLKFVAREKGRRTPVVIQETYVDARGKPRHRFSRACPVCGSAMPGYRPLLLQEVADIAGALPGHGLFFFDRVAPGTLELARRSRDQGALVVFEPSGIKDDSLFVECLRVSHVLKYSHERLSGLESLLNRARPVLEIETLGEAGLRFRLGTHSRASTWRHLPAVPALSIRDAAGSGDWCTAGFLARLAGDGQTPIEQLEDVAALMDALRFGQALAALNCSFDGARGLMYALNRTRVMKAAERMLADDVPSLPKGGGPTKHAPRSRGGCVVCAKDLQAVYS